MAVQHCVRACLGPHCILAQKEYCQKLMAQLNSTAFFLPLYVYFEAIKLFMKNSVTLLDKSKGTKDKTFVKASNKNGTLNMPVEF